MLNLYRYIAYALIVFTLTACGSAQPAEAATKAQSIQFLLSQVRASGVALSGGKVDFYEAGATTTRKTVWLDRNKATPAANPYTLDSNGTAQLYGDGLYRIVIKDSTGVTKYDRDYISIKEVAGNVYDVADYASLAAAVASIGSTPATLQFAADVTITANLVIPSTLELMPLNGAVINHGSYTISYAGSTARWPMAQVLNGSGAVTGINEVRPMWFGPSVANTDVGSIQKALNCAASFSSGSFDKGLKGKVIITGEWWSGVSLQWDVGRVVIEGSGIINALAAIPNTSYLITTTNTAYSIGYPLFQADGGMSNIILRGPRVGAAGCRSIHFTGDTTNDGTNPGASRISLRNVIINGFSTGAVFGSHAYMIAFYNCAIEENVTGLEFTFGHDNASRSYFYSCHIDSCTTGILLNVTGGYGPSFFGGAVGQNGVSVNIPSGNGFISFDGTHIESPAGWATISGAAGFGSPGGAISISNAVFNVTPPLVIATAGGFAGGFPRVNIRDSLIISTSATNTEFISGPAIISTSGNQVATPGSQIVNMGGSANLLADGGFESNVAFKDDIQAFTGGVGVTAITIQPASPRTGTYSLRSIMTTGGSVTGGRLFIPIQPSSNVRFNWWGLMPGGTTGNLGVKWYYATSNRTLATTIVSASVTLTGAYQQNLGVVNDTLQNQTAPAWARYLVFEWDMSALVGATPTVYFDDLGAWSF